jgi:hypothetical protein
MKLCLIANHKKLNQATDPLLVFIFNQQLVYPIVQLLALLFQLQQNTNLYKNSNSRFLKALINHGLNIP